MDREPNLNPYKRLFETMLDGAVVLDVTTGLIALANKAAATIFGFPSPEEMVGLNPLDYVPQEDHEHVAQMMAESFERDRQTPAEMRIITRDKRQVWVSASGTLIEHEGKKATFTTIRDITSERAKDAALRDAERRYEHLFDGMLDGAVVLDISTFQIALANKAAAEMFGFSSPRELVGENPLSYIPEDDRDEVARMIALNLQGEGRNPAEIRVITRDKRNIWVSAIATAIDYEGRTATLTTLRDITADKAKDAALRAAEEGKIQLIDAAAESIFVVQDWKMVYVNPAGAAVAGLSQKDMIGLSFRDFVHPDQRETLTERYERLLAGQWFSDFTTVKGIDAKGEVRWAEIREIPYSWQGRPAVMSLAHDITDRMRADEERKEREERLRSIIENAWDGITILDENYNAIFESPSLARISGYTPEEWMGRPVGQMAIHPDDLVWLASRMETLKSQPDLVIRDVVVRYQHKDGSWRWIEATGRNLLHDPRVKGLVINFRDITERKRTEDEGRRLSTAIEQAADIVVVTDREGTIQYVNPAFTRTTGYTSDEAIGQNPRVLKSGRHDQAFYRDLWDTITAGKTWAGHFVNKKKDGSLYNEEATISPIRNASGEITNFVAVKHDVTERLRTLEALENSEQRFRALIENATDAVAIVGPNGEILYESPAARTISGYTTEEMVGHYVTEYIAPEDLGKVADLFVDLKGHPGKTIPPFEVRFKHGDGSWHTAEMTVQNLLHVPGIGGAVVNYHDITDRLKAEEALKNSEERFRTLIEKATDVVIVLDAGGKITYQSPSLERVTGYGPNEWLDRSLGELFIHPDDLPSLASLLERVLTQPGATFEGVTARYKHKDGSWHPLEATVTNMLHDPKVNGLVANFRDITDRRAAQEALVESEQKYRLLVENSSDLIFSLDTQGNFTYVSPALERISGYGVDEVIGTSFLRFVVPEDLPALMASFESTLAGATEPSEFRAVLKDGTIRHVRTTSRMVRQDAKVTGLTGVMSDITERKRAEEALRASEERNRLLIDNAAEVVTVIQDGLIKFINRKVIDLAGYSPEELVSKPFIELIHPDDRQMVADNYVKRLSGGEVPATYQMRVVHKNGDTRWAATSVALSTWEGRPSTLGLLSDITERKKAEEALRVSEEKNRLIIDNANEAVTVIQDGQIKFINPKFSRATGYAAEELLLKPFMELIHPDDRQMAADYYFRRLKGEEVPATYQFKFLDKAGDTKWAEINAVLFDWEGRPATLGLLSDITERKQAEAEILALSNAFGATLDPVLILDMQGNVRNTNEAAKRLFETDELGIGALKYVVPEDEERVASAMQGLIASGRATVDRFSIVTRSGRRVPIEASASLMLDANGKPVGIVVVERDITERRKAEETLRESEEKFRLITEKTNDLVWMTDINLVTIYVSPSAERLLGFRPEELLKLSPESLMKPESLGRAQEILLKQLDLERDPMADPQRTVTLELEYYRKDGSTVWLENRISGIRDANGVLTGMHGVGRDISERKMAERALKESEERFRTLIEKSTDAIAILDATGNLLYESPSMERITGYRLEDWVGKPVGDWLLHPDDLAAMTSLLEKLISQPDATSEEVSVRFKHKDGSWHFLEGTVRNLLSDPKVKGLVINYRDVTERRLAEQAVRESERKFKALFDSANDGIFIHHLTGPFLEVNEIACQQLGYTREELLRLTPGDIDSPEYAAKVPERTEELVRNGQAVFETAHLARDGRVIPIEASSRIVDFGGKTAVLTIARDITERKKAQRALLASEVKYRNLFEHTLLGMEVIDGETGKVVFSNHSMARMFGFKSPEEMAGTNPMDYVPPEDLEWVTKELAHAMADPEKHDVATLRAKTEDGRTIWVTASGTSIEYEGKPSMLLSLIEVTAAKEAEDKLRDSEEKNRLLIDNAAEGIAVVQDGLLKFVNPKCAEFTGRAAEELISTPFLEIVHPEDRQKMAENYAKRLAGGEIPSDYQFRIIDKQGGTKSLQINAVRFNWEGREATLSILSDITERVKAQQALKDSEERFRALIEEATDAVAILEPSGKTIYYSASMRRVTGYTPEEWAGKSLGDLLIHPDDLVSLASLLEEMKKPKATAEGVRVRYVHKDGSWHTLEATIRNMLHDPKIGGIVANFRDVTERVKAEQALKESEERYRLFADNVSDVIWVTDMNLKPIYISPSVARMLGYTGDQAMTGAVETRLTPASAQMALQAYADAMAKEAEHPGSEWDEPPLDLEMVRSDGSTVWTATKFSFIRADDGKPFAILGVLRDVTDRKKAGDSLRKSEERFRGLVETSSDWVWEIDRNSHYTYVSPKVRDILGHEPQELLGHTPFEFMHQREGRRVSKIVRRFADAHLPFSLLENTCIHKDGHSVVLETSAVPILDNDGDFLGYRGTDRDITERKKVEQELQHSLKRLEKTMESTIEAITTTIETRDPYTTGHQMRVTDLACAIAKVMEVPPTQIEGIRVAGLLHDIGKIAIPTEILSKPGKLTEVEFSMIKTHAKTGYNILKKIEFAWPVARVVLQHHERWNGSGYPHGIRGEDILLEARILAVADVMEAMASHRPYRPSVGLDKALDEISKNSGILYDPAVAKACETAFARDGFKFATAVPGVVADSGSTSSDRPVHSTEDR